MAMTEWIYNSNSGAVNEMPTPFAEAALHTGTGWHGPFTDKQKALDYYTANRPSNPGWKAPAGWTDQLGNVASTAGGAVADAASALNPFKGLNLQSWLIRIGEILLGVVLIGVGIAKMTGTTNVISKIAKVAI